MNILALLLVLVSAVAHATWNLFAKRTNGGALLVWLYDILSTILYAPVVVILLIVQRQSLSLIGLLFIVGSAILHLTYFILLQRGYRVGDLSLVYPLARGTGPLLSTICAIVLFAERPTLIALAGMGLVVAGIFVITGGSRIFSGRVKRGGIIYGLIIGLFIASYTLWDKQGVSVLLVPPLLYYYGTIVFRLALLTPYALPHWNDLRQEWGLHRAEIIGVAVLSPLSYFLVLTALVFTPVSYVAPTREIGVLFGVLMGTRLLAEGETKRRLIAAGMIVVGIIALAI